MEYPENSSYIQQDRQGRTNQQWLNSLRGQAGPASQQETIEALGSYLHVVAYNYLCRCRANSEKLTSWENSELGTLAEDYVRTFMEMLIQNDFALLDKYHQRGRFTAWAVAVLINLMVSDAAWQKQVRLATSVSAHRADEWSRQPDVVIMS